MRSGNAAGKHNCYVVRLLGGANPVFDSPDGLSADPVEWQMTMRCNGFDQAVLAKFAEFVFRFRHSITERDKDVAWPEINALFLVLHVVKQAHNHATCLKSADGAIFTEDDGSEMTGVRVRHTAGLAVIKAEE